MVKNKARENMHSGADVDKEQEREREKKRRKNFSQISLLHKPGTLTNEYELNKQQQMITPNNISSNIPRKMH